MSRRKVLVVGGTGLLGGKVVTRLFQQGHEVRSGQYVADTTLQHRLFGDVPSLRDSIKLWVHQNGLYESGSHT